MDDGYCPCCYDEENYEFHWGVFEPEHRFGGSEPHEGYCSNCGFRYVEHIKHPEEEQVANYRLHCIKQMQHLDRALLWLSRIIRKRTIGNGGDSTMWYRYALKNTEKAEAEKE